MGPLLLIVALFGAWWLIGLAFLALVRADTGSLRIALTAPAVGTAATLLPLFILSDAGLAMDNAARPVAAVLLVLAACVVARKRPAVPRAVLPVLLICLVGVVLEGWPMFEFGSHWLANANDDMANYVLSATELLHGGLLAPVDVAGLTRNTDYASFMHTFHALGARPGADITLAGLAGLTGRPAYQVYMPFTLALNLCGICGTAALAMQAARRWWAAVVAALLIAVSPLATFGVLQQLLPQVWGLALATALVALLFRADLHRGRRPSLSDVAPISLLVFAVVLVYVELASTLAVGYALYVAVLAVRRRLDLRVAARVWIPAVASAAIVLNAYGVREMRYVLRQASFGAHALPGVDQFGFAIVPSALAGVVGLQTMPVQAGSHWLSASIAVAIVLLFAIFVVTVVTFPKGVAASAALICYAGTAVYLAVHSGDFGLYKLYMYLQPFIAAGVAVWIASSRRRLVPLILALPLAVAVGFQVSTQQAYVRASRDPGGLPFASSASLLPAFADFARAARTPLVTVTENPTLGKLEAVAAGTRPLYFMSQNLFAYIGTPAGFRANGWRLSSFMLDGDDSQSVDPFLENTHIASALRTPGCDIVVPSTAESVFNRYTAGPGSAPLLFQRCDKVVNLLVFTASRLGGSFYAYSSRRYVSFYQTEPDQFFPGHSMSAFGRYVLLRVVNPSKSVRLELNLTTTYTGGTALPPAAVVGTSRIPLDLVGRGSARVFSAPIRPQTIDGASYLLLDLGRTGALFHKSRSGLQGLFGSSIPLDARFLTAYVRDVSLVDTSQYSRLSPPDVLDSFPAALANPDLRYSGIDESGFVATDSYAVLAGGKSANLRLTANVFPAPAGQHLRVLVNGTQVFSQTVQPGPLNVNVGLAASDSPRRVELRWTFAPRLPAPDDRSAAAALTYLGLTPRTGAAAAPVSLRNTPADLSNPSLQDSGIYSDGWLTQDSYVVLAGGPTASLLLRAVAQGAPGGQALTLLVNGRELLARKVAAGPLALRVALPASASTRRIELRWAAAPKLPAPDGRSAAALLKFIGVVSALHR